MNNDPNYVRLREVLTDAYNQAAEGKGKERHANDLPFEEQPMQAIAELIHSHKGMAQQVIKKTQESLSMGNAAAIRELYGVINYAAGMIIYLENRISEGERI